MSAIAGILYFDGAPVEHGLIEKLTGAMKSRGPDAQTHWMQGSVALGHCMLRTTPESLEEHQPLMSQDGKLVMVWDGRLDNREELQRNLKAAGVVLRDNSDAELALQSYAVWRRECPRQLLGDFAFAVWDAGLSELFCARDHMGARPFYYTRNDWFFAFASEDEALLNLPGVSNKPNEELIAYFLVPGFLGFNYSRSWLEDIWALPSASSITVAAKAVSGPETYWKLEPGPEMQFSSDEECRQAFLAVFGEAVRCRMRAIGNISAMMSGGMDSASIAAMGKRLQPEMPGKEFHTYSAISDHPESCVESQCILSLIKGLASNAHFVTVPSFVGMVSVEDLIDVGWSRPHPVDNSILLPAMMFRAAARDGQRVMLHGACGDLAMYVPPRYLVYLLRAGRWREAWTESRGASRNSSYLQGMSPSWILAMNVWEAFMPRGAKLLMHRMREMKSGSSLSRSPINRAFAKAMRLEQRIRAWEARTRSFVGMQEANIRALSPPHGVESALTGYDKVAGPYGLELRDPWGDRRVVEFCLRLPLQYKVRNGWTKYLVRSAFSKDLANEIWWRKGKEHVGWNFTKRLMGESRSFVEQVLGQGGTVLGRYMEIDILNKKYAKYAESNENADRELVYDAVILALWLRRSQLGPQA